MPIEAKTQEYAKFSSSRVTDPDLGPGTNPDPQLNIFGSGSGKRLIFSISLGAISKIFFVDTVYFLPLKTKQIFGAISKRIFFADIVYLLQSETKQNFLVYISVLSKVRCCVGYGFKNFLLSPIRIYLL
jgi:hypothetical protein